MLQSGARTDQLAKCGPPGRVLRTSASALATRGQFGTAEVLHGRLTMQKKLVLETTAPFQGLAELVAYDEGLFEKEGIAIEWADRDEAGIKTVDTSLTDVKGA